MKKVLVFAVLIVGFGFVASAQTEELKSAQANIDGKNYIKALEDISKAKTAVSKLVGEDIASVLPDEIDGFKMENDGDNSMEMFSGISVQRAYRKPAVKQTKTLDEPSGANAGAQEGEMGAMQEPAMMGMEMNPQPEIHVRISTDMMQAGEVASAHSNSEGGYVQEGVSPVRIKGYRAIVRKSMEGGDPMMGGRSSETVLVIVGGALVSIDARGVDSGLAEKLADAIDFPKLKSMIGE